MNHEEIFAPEFEVEQWNYNCLPNFFALYACVWFRLYLHFQKLTGHYHWLHIVWVFCVILKKYRTVMSERKLVYVWMLSIVKISRLLCICNVRDYVSQTRVCGAVLLTIVPMWWHCYRWESLKNVHCVTCLAIALKIVIRRTGIRVIN